MSRFIFAVKGQREGLAGCFNEDSRHLWLRVGRRDGLATHGHGVDSTRDGWWSLKC